MKKKSLKQKNFLIATTCLLSMFFLLIFPAQTLAFNSNQLLKLINQQRQKNNLLPFKENEALHKVASQRAQDMMQNNYFSHQSPDGETFIDSLREMKYYYKEAGENLAINFQNPDQVFQAWMNSPGHKNNIFNKLYTDTGIGLATKKENNGQKIIIVQLFSSPGNQTFFNDKILVSASPIQGNLQVLGAYTDNSFNWIKKVDYFIIILTAFILLFFVKKNITNKEQTNHV